MRAARWIGSSCAVVAALSLAIACRANAHLRLESSSGAAVSLEAGVSAGGGYAAMDELPAAGGELRLAVPQVVIVDGASREEIGFPLRHTAITARVAGMMAQYEVEQVFDNPYPVPIEAVYVFPLGDDGAVSGYQLRIGERTITGEIRTREDARRVFDEARARGHTAGLVEQEKPNVFTQRVTNIAPGETITVKLTYVELLDFADGRYDLVVPLVVGPRYLPAERDRTPVTSRHAGAPGSPGLTSIPYVDATRAGSTVSFSAVIDAGVPIAGVDSPSHDLDVTALSPTQTKVTLLCPDEIPNRDLVVRYRTAGPRTQVGLLADRRDDDGYFLLTIQPKAEYRTGDIAAREVLIVIDTSGSMDGEPLAQAKAVASGLLGTLTDRDRFDIISFASGVDAMAGALVSGDAAGRARGMEHLRRLQAGGGTEMQDGVERMLTTAPGEDRVRTIYFLTDGFIGNDDVVVGAAKRLLGANRIFTIGIGSAPNRSLLDRLARTGRGFSSYLGLTESPQPLVASLVKRSAYPYLTDVRVSWGGLDVDALTPAIVPDVYAGEPLVITGRYRTPGSAKVVVEGRSGGRPFSLPVEVTLPERSDLEPVASLWARRQIEDLLATREDRSEDALRAAVSALGLRFHLITEFTSFVAVDRSRVVGSGQPLVIEQPAIVPEGVNPDTSIGEAPAVSSSSSGYRHDNDSRWSGGGGWGSGGPAGERAGLGLVLALIALVGTLWLAARRFA